MFGPQGMRTEGGYPALDQFRGPGPDEEEGETKLVKLPSRRLGWWENHSHFEIAYDGETMAETLLGMNYIPEQISGPGFDPDIREEVTEKLDLDPFTSEEDLRVQLREIVGMDEEDDEAAQVEESDPRIEDLTNTDRSLLIKVTNTYDDVDDLTDEADASSVSHLKNTEMAEFLAGKDDDEVDRRLNTAEQGGEE